MLPKARVGSSDVDYFLFPAHKEERHMAFDNRPEPVEPKPWLSKAPSSSAEQEVRRGALFSTVLLLVLKALITMLSITVRLTTPHPHLTPPRSLVPSLHFVLLQAKQQRHMEAQKRNTGVAVEVAAAAMALSQTYKTAGDTSTERRAAVPIAEMNKRAKAMGSAAADSEAAADGARRDEDRSKSWSVKEKRKRDLGQANRALRRGTTENNRDGRETLGSSFAESSSDLPYRPSCLLILPCTLFPQRREKLRRGGEAHSARVRPAKRWPRLWLIGSLARILQHLPF